MIRRVSILAALCCVAPLSAAEPSPALDARAAFFARLCDLQGAAFVGLTVFTSLEDDPFADARLIMFVESCDESTIRVPFRVGDDASRTWIITLGDDGSLQLKHDHRDDDGTPHDLTNYGGVATDDGSNPHRQRFPADDETVAMLPAAATNVWTLEFVPDRAVFVYDLQRHGAPRFRAEFDLTTPVERHD